MTFSNTRLYVGNLSWKTTEASLREALAVNGRTVTKVDIKTDTKTGRSRGFAFVDLASEEEAQAAVDELHGTELNGRPLKVSTAKEQKRTTGGFGRGERSYDDRRDRGGFGRGGGGGGGGRRW